MKRIVRSQFNLKNYDDSENGFPPSIVDTSCYVPPEELVQRFLSGRVTKDEVRGRVYTVDPSMTADEAISQMAPNRVSGFDITDANRIIKDVVKRTRTAGKSRKEPPEAPGPKGEGGGVPPIPEKSKEEASSPLPDDLK